MNASPKQMNVKIQFGYRAWTKIESNKSLKLVCLPQSTLADEINGKVGLSIQEENERTCVESYISSTRVKLATVKYGKQTNFSN